MIPGCDLADHPFCFAPPPATARGAVILLQEGHAEISDRKDMFNMRKYGDWLHSGYNNQQQDLLIEKNEHNIQQNIVIRGPTNQVQVLHTACRRGSNTSTTH